MNLVPYADAPAYDAPGHDRMAMRRLQGKEAGPSDNVWMGLSVIAPGGGTTLTASGVEKFYVVIEGELEITAVLPDQPPRTETMRVKDSCRIAPGESRRLHNPGSLPCSVLLVMPNG